MRGLNNNITVQLKGVNDGPLTWEIPDSNSSGFSPLGFTILALVLNMAFVSAITSFAYSGYFPELLQG